MNERRGLEKRLNVEKELEKHEGKMEAKRMRERKRFVRIKGENRRGEQKMNGEGENKRGKKMQGSLFFLLQQSVTLGEEIEISLP